MIRVLLLLTFLIFAKPGHPAPAASLVAIAADALSLLTPADATRTDNELRAVIQSQVDAWKRGDLGGFLKAAFRLLSPQSEARMPFPLDSDDMEQTPPQTEDSEERGFVKKQDDRELGRAEELDQQDAGDIADEGPGRRG